MILEERCPKSRCLQGQALLRPPGVGHSSSLPLSGVLGLWQPNSHLCLRLPVDISPCVSLFTLVLSSFHEEMSHVGFRYVLIKVNLIAPAKTLFSNKVSFTGTGNCDFNKLFICFYLGGGTIKHI